MVVPFKKNEFIFVLFYVLKVKVDFDAISQIKNNFVFLLLILEFLLLKNLFNGHSLTTIFSRFFTSFN